MPTDVFGGDGFIGSFGGGGGGGSAGSAGGRIAPPVAMAQEDAVARFAPRVVLCSWMPEEDWTAAWRAHPSVEAYVLLGEAAGGQSGRPWPTWGLRPSAVFGAKEADLPLLKVAPNY